MKSSFLLLAALLCASWPGAGLAQNLGRGTGQNYYSQGSVQPGSPNRTAPSASASAGTVAPAVRSVAPGTRFTGGGVPRNGNAVTAPRSYAAQGVRGGIAPAGSQAVSPRFSTNPFVPAARPALAYQRGYGGTVPNGRSQVNNNGNNYNNVGTTNRGAYGYRNNGYAGANTANRNAFANAPRWAPGNVSGRWDHRHDYAWNHHRYRWGGNQWIIVDTDPYFYSYEGPVGVVSTIDSGEYETVAPNVVEVPAPVANDGSLTADVQQALAQLGYYAGPIDGVLGPETRSAIAECEASNHLPADGRISARFLNLLGL